MSSNIETKLDELIAKLTEQNKTVQEGKASPPWGWITAIIVALLSLVGIGVAMYLANRKAKELAAARTELEHLRIDAAQKEHQAAQETLLGKRNELLKEATQLEEQMRNRAEDLRRAEQAHAERQKQLEGLRAWDDINAA
jgi:DNA repair exonuclease SbcCD ATPase subunit